MLAQSHIAQPPEPLCRQRLGEARHFAQLLAAAAEGAEIRAATRYRAPTIKQRVYATCGIGRNDSLPEGGAERHPAVDDLLSMPQLRQSALGNQPRRSGETGGLGARDWRQPRWGELPPLRAQCRQRRLNIGRAGVDAYGPVAQRCCRTVNDDFDIAHELHDALSDAGARGAVRLEESGQWVVRLRRGQSNQGFSFPPDGPDRDEWLAAMTDRLADATGVRPEVETDD